MSHQPSVAPQPDHAPTMTVGSWARYRDQMITAGQMTEAVHWAGLATPLDRVPGVFVVADRFSDREHVLDIGHAHDLRAHFSDMHRIASWHDQTSGEVVIYTIPNSTLMDRILPQVPDVTGSLDYFPD